MRGLYLALVAAVALTGCALLRKSDPVVPRYFTPEQEGELTTAAGLPGLQVRMGRVEGWTHLRERMVARGPGREVVLRDHWRWMERPETYLRRALVRTLFEERGLREALTGRAPTLEVELIAFEELEKPHAVRMQARLMLVEERVTLLAETVTVLQPIGESGASDRARDVVEAFSLALQSGVTRIADRVIAKLAEPAAPGVEAPERGTGKGEEATPASPGAR